MAAEPVRRNLHYLLRNIEDNGWAQNAEVFPVAVGERADILKMWGGGTGASLVRGWASIPESYVNSVPVIALDGLLGNRLHSKRALILVDIEGAEYMMLKGALATLANSVRPIWLIEISMDEHQPTGTKINPNFSQTFELFFGMGYRAFTADDRLMELTGQQIRQAVSSGDTKMQTHNFLFR